MPRCPLCDEPTSNVLNTFSAADIAELFCPEMLSREMYARMQETLTQLWKQQFVRICKCGGCDFGFSDPFVAGSAGFYQLQSPDTPYPRNKWEYQRTLKVLSGLKAKVSSVLDVGAGKGHFLGHLISNGWSPNRLEATEFSAAGANAIEGLGVICHRSDVRELKHSGPRFDAICLFQVLEHLDDYDELLRSLGKLTNSNGHLFIAVPNGNRVDFNEQAGLQYDCPPNHISRWTPDSLRIFAKKYGWQIDAIELEPSASIMQEARYGAINRFLRNSHVRGSWARSSYETADRWFPHNSRGNKAFKAAAMALSADAWRSGLKVALAARRGAVPHALWVHLRRGTP